MILLLPQFLIIWFSNLSIMSVPDEGYARNTPCTLNLISPSFFFIYVYNHRFTQLFSFDIMVKRDNVIRKGLSSYLKTNADMEWVGDLVVL